MRRKVCQVVPRAGHVPLRWAGVLGVHLCDGVRASGFVRMTQAPEAL